MLLTLTTTHQPATDLGYLLHKNPARPQSFEMSFGKAHVFYPSVSNESCTVALLLEVDPIGLVRGHKSTSKSGNEGGTADQYVNDRPYVASSFMSVALKQIFGSALAGRCKERPALVEQNLPLKARLAVVPSRGGAKWLPRLFEPLGYTVTIENYPLDETQPQWGNSSYYTLTLEANCRLSDLLSHLYVLIPVLDEDKHYWIGEEEVEKLLRHGEGWLSTHPEREFITQRYLKFRSLVKTALIRLLEAEEGASDPAETEVNEAASEVAIEKPISLNEQRLTSVVAMVKAAGAKRVLDLGCGEGRLLQRLLAEKGFERVVGLDVSQRTLEMARDRLHLDEMPARQKERLELLQGSLTYRDGRLNGYDAACVVEVIEHLDLPRLAAFERVLFEFARPGLVIITTPNAEYNVRFEKLAAGQFRHRDHRFEWTRAEFQAWAELVARQHGYQVSFEPIGPQDVEIGPPTQMGVFKR